jgi:hypothetical protein
MLIDKHRADNIFRRVPGLTIKMNPELAAIDKVLDDEELFCLLRVTWLAGTRRRKAAGASRRRWK